MKTRYIISTILACFALLCGCSPMEIVRTTDELTLKATATGADINVGAVSVGAGNTLSFDSVDIVKLGGVLANNGMVAIDAGGEFVVTGAVNNTGTVNISANMVDVTDVDNSGDMEIIKVQPRLIHGETALPGFVRRFRFQ